MSRAVAGRLTIVGLAVALAALASACSKPAPPPQPLSVIVTDDLAPLVRELTADFNGRQRGAVAATAVVSSRQLPAALARDPEAIVVYYSLSATQALSETVFAVDAIAVTVALTNPVESLTPDQIGQIFTGRVSDWAEVGGRAQPMVPLSREEGALSREVFEQNFIGRGGRVTRNALVASTDGGMVAMIQSTPGAIGYALLRALTPEVRPLRIGGVPPSAAAIRQGRYTLVLPVAASAVGTPQAAAAAFLGYLRGPAGQAIVQSQGFVPVP